MKFTGYVTVRLNSTRVSHKSIRIFGGKPLVNYAIETLYSSGIEDIILYCSTPKITDYISCEVPYRFVERPVYLDGDSITFNNILSSIIEDIDTDYLVFLCCTSPFIKPETIVEMVEAVKSLKFDSSFTAFKFQSFSWYDGIPLNYNINNIQKTQDIKPIHIETSGLYVFSKELFKRYGRRIGFNPYIKEVDVLEGLDIDTEEDWDIATKIKGII